MPVFLKYNGFLIVKVIQLFDCCKINLKNLEASKQFNFILILMFTYFIYRWIERES